MSQKHSLGTQPLSIIIRVTLTLATTAAMMISSMPVSAQTQSPYSCLLFDVSDGNSSSGYRSALNIDNDQLLDKDAAFKLLDEQQAYQTDVMLDDERYRVSYETVLQPLEVTSTNSYSVQYIRVLRILDTMTDSVTTLTPPDMSDLIHIYVPSADGKRLIYAFNDKEGVLHVVNTSADGKDKRERTFARSEPGGGSRVISLSPNRKYILIDHNEKTEQGIGIYLSDTLEEVDLKQAFDSSSAFEIPGKNLYLARWVESQDAALYIGFFDESAIQIYLVDLIERTAEKRWLLKGKFIETELSYGGPSVAQQFSANTWFSADGEWIAWLRRDGTSENSANAIGLQFLNLNGNERNLEGSIPSAYAHDQIARNSVKIGFAGDPVRFVFSRVKTGTVRNIPYLVSVDPLTGEEVSLTPQGETEINTTEIAWSSQWGRALFVWKQRGEGTTETEQLVTSDLYGQWTVLSAVNASSPRDLLFGFMTDEDAIVVSENKRDSQESAITKYTPDSSSLPEPGFKATVLVESSERQLFIGQINLYDDSQTSQRVRELIYVSTRDRYFNTLYRLNLDTLRQTEVMTDRFVLSARSTGLSHPLGLGSSGHLRTVSDRDFVVSWRTLSEVGVTFYRSDFAEIKTFKGDLTTVLPDPYKPPTPPPAITSGSDQQITIENPFGMALSTIQHDFSFDYAPKRFPDAIYGAFASGKSVLTISDSGEIYTLKDIQLTVQGADGTSTFTLPNLQIYQLPVLSPDGRYIAYFKVDEAGAKPTPIVEVVNQSGVVVTSSAVAVALDPVRYGNLSPEELKREEKTHARSAISNIRFTKCRN